MSVTAVVTMILILAFVWGGFMLAVATAVRKERRKTPAAANARGSSGERA